MVANEEVHIAEKSVFGSRQIPGNLGHDLTIGLTANVGNLYFALGQLHHEEDLETYQPTHGPDFYIEKVCNCHDIHMRASKLLPVGAFTTFWGRNDALGPKDVADRRIADIEADMR